MKLTFFGAAGEVGRSCILLESGSTRVLLDAGVKLGSHIEYPTIEDSKLADLDAVIVTHAHLDHCGYLPHLYSGGFKGKIYVTKPTMELVNVLVSDYLSLSKPKNVTKEGERAMRKNFAIVDYHKEFKINDTSFKMLQAGHILGSAMIEAHGDDKRVLYTGDINLRGTNVLNPAYTEYLNADALITESTYGGNKDLLPSSKNIANGMISSITETINAGGKVIIPSFAVDRGEAILFLIDNYMRSGLLPKTKIYIDGMINKTMRIYRHNVIYCKEELQKRILMSEDDPFKSPNFRGVTTKAARSKLLHSDEAAIIVTTSGMLTGGPVMRYLGKFAKDPKNKLLFIGYQAVGTPGRALADGAKEITINDVKVPVNLSVEQYQLSGHADRQQLMKLIGKVENLKKIFIVHGEENKSLEFYETLKKKYQTFLPKLNNEFTV